MRFRFVAVLGVGLASFDAAATRLRALLSNRWFPRTPYPRIEVFTEVANACCTQREPDRGGRPSGAAVCSRAVEAQAGVLSSQPLAFLPYFGEAKPNTTLGAFVDATGAAKAALLPKNLDALSALPTSTRANQATLADAGLAKFERVVVVWLDARRWYVDQVFYRFERFDPLGLPQGPCDEVMDGSLAQFIHFSPLLTARRVEGLAALRHPKLAPMPPDGESVFQLQRTPGGPGSYSYWVNIYGDGTVGSASSVLAPRGFAPHHVTAALILASQRKLRTDDASGPTEDYRSDRQALLFQWWVAGTQHRFTIDGSAPPEVADAQSLVRIFQLDNDPRRPPR
ncbi:MAG: hypothetical protein U0787_14085 [Polyangia bacterium]